MAARRQAARRQGRNGFAATIAPARAAFIVALVALLALPAAASAELNYPLPGGKYVGETKRDRRVKLTLSSESANGKIRGRFKLPCAGIDKGFKLDDPDGRFKVKKENRRGETVFRAKGRFSKLEKARGRVKKVKSDKRRCTTGRYRTKLEGHEEIRRATVTYGPYGVHPSEGGHGHGGHTNIVEPQVDKPCEDCYLVAMEPDLVHADGSSANFATDAMLHHTVLSNRGSRDATCNGRERFFASGNERTDFVLPRGYGYRVDAGDRWRALSHLMNMGHAMQMLTVQITFAYVPAPADLEAVRPMWLDVDNCGDSEYSIPAGRSNTTWDFEVTPGLHGNLIAIGGHQHNEGVRIVLTNATERVPLCASFAGYGSDPAYMGNIESMTGCAGDPLARIEAGEVLRLHSFYTSPEPQHDVMGIMLGYVDPDVDP